jgi:hypothetical protein
MKESLVSPAKEGRAPRRIKMTPGFGITGALPWQFATGRVAQKRRSRGLVN